MGKIQIVFFDVHGTILNPKTNEISVKTKESLKALHNEGIKLCAITRGDYMNIPNLEELDFDAYITGNGMFCYSKDILIYEQDKKNENNKNNAVSKILEYFHLNKDESLAFGIGDNDIELFSSVVGYIVAMGDATRRFKTISNEICGTIADEGIYKFLLNHLII